jgi:aminomethyltransferase
LAESKRTPLYEAHRALGARMVEFAGFAMPVQYSGIIDEHRAVRSAAGVFDVSHMGEVEVAGPRAAEAVQRIVTNHIGKLTPGRALYTVACREGGGIVDDLIVYRLSDDRFLIVVNASNIEKDFAWFRDVAGQIAELADRSDDTALLAVQGPRAPALVQGLWRGPDLGGLATFQFASGEVAGRRAMAARTGYTGEDGFELFLRADEARPVWDAILEAGTKPCGLGARDTLRLEARLCLYGNDIDETTSPLEAGLGWVVKFDAADFVGKSALVEQKRAGITRRLVGFVMQERGIARHGYAILEPEGKTAVGTVTSGAPSPSTGQNIGLGYVPIALAEPGQRLVIDCRGKPVAAVVHKGPFYQRGART